jgi:hypothetical protein
MKDRKIVREGSWYNSKVVKRSVIITLSNEYSGKIYFDVWFETMQDQLDVYGGTYDSEYEAITMIEKIIGQKVQWHVAV